MPGVVPYARSVYAALALAESTFGSLLLEGEGGCEKAVSLRKEFRAQALVALRRGESIMIDLKLWRHLVQCGEVEFDSRREDGFRAAVRAFIDLSSFLVDKFDEFCNRGLFLTHPRVVSILESYGREANKILDSWQSPEWETANERTVKWDKEQTRYLRAKIGSCN